MNTVDVIVVLVVLLNGTIGAYKGFVWQAVRLSSILLGITVAWKFGPDLAAWSASWVSWDATGRGVIAYVAIFLCTYLMLSWLGHLCRDWIDKRQLTSTDRSFGFILGTAKGLLVLWLAFFLVLPFDKVDLLPTYLETELNGEGTEDSKRSKSYAIWKRLSGKLLEEDAPEDK